MNDGGSVEKAPDRAPAGPDEREEEAAFYSSDADEANKSSH